MLEEPIQRYEVCNTPKINKTEVQAIIKYLQKKDMTPKEIHENIVQKFSEDSLSNATVKKLATELKNFNH